MPWRPETTPWLRCRADDCREAAVELGYCEDHQPRECNCCGRMMPNVTQCWTTCGLETWACEDCTSDPREAGLAERPDPDRLYDERRDRDMEAKLYGWCPDLED
jgi:hypothetical protein